MTVEPILFRLLAAGGLSLGAFAAAAAFAIRLRRQSQAFVHLDLRLEL